MRYVEFRDRIRDRLRSRPGGETWAELRNALDLPYERPCPTWLKQLESDIDLTREKGAGRALVWRVRRR
jgi:hypothetical protein